MRGRPGIGLAHWLYMRATNPTFREWSEAVRPGVAWCIELRPLNESLTRWSATRLARGYCVLATGEWARSTTIIYTPPCRPEWLEVLA